MSTLSEAIQSKVVKIESELPTKAVELGRNVLAPKLG